MEKLAEENYSKKCSAMFTVSRAFSLVSIVAAHIVFPPNDFDFLNKLYSAIGLIGVSVFFFISAYYYNTEKFSGLWELLKKKLVSIGLPWLALGTVAYLYNAVLSGNFGIIKWLAWLLGYKTYLYFLTVLFFCFVIFYKANKIFCILCIPLSVISITLTSLGVLDPIISFLHITNYLNILNWIGVFAVGRLVKSADCEKLYTFIFKYRFLWITVFILSMAVMIAFGLNDGYFSPLGLCFEIFGALFIFSVSTFKIFNRKLFYSIANNSFSIYLIHLPLIGVLDRVYNLTPVSQAISVFLVILIAHFGLEIARLIVCKTKCKKIFYMLFGFRDRKVS